MPTESESRGASSAAPYDAIVIGGSYAGLSAAMPLARARRRLLVIDAGERRNRYAASSHGFLGQDGRSPDAIALEGRRQLLRYPTVEWHEGRATAVARVDDAFAVETADGARHLARRLVLATGVVDELPEIEGLRERWGRSLFHCPYCHGYELDRGAIGVIGVGQDSMHHALMLPDWGTVTFLLNDSFEPDEAQRAALQARGVALEPRRILRVIDTATVELADGHRLALDGLFVMPRMRMSSAIPEQLGCAFDEGPLGSAVIRTDAMKQTTVAGVFACGDAARLGGSVALAVGDGAMAGVAAHRSLMFG